MAQVPDTFSHLRHRRPKYRSEMAFILFRPCKRQFHADEIGYFTDAVRQEEHFAALEGVFVLAVRGVFRCTGRFFRGCRTPPAIYGVRGPHLGPRRTPQDLSGVRGLPFWGSPAVRRAFRCSGRARWRKGTRDAARARLTRSCTGVHTERSARERAAREEARTSHRPLGEGWPPLLLWQPESPDRPLEQGGHRCFIRLPKKLLYQRRKSVPK